MMRSSSLHFNVSTARHWLGHFVEPQMLFPAIAVLVLGVIWGSTFHLIKVERMNAEHALETSTLELVNTYEAQMLRNLREIDQTLKMIKYAYESTGDPLLLSNLKNKGLLPPELLFAISITDARGNVVASTRAGDAKKRIVGYMRHFTMPDLWISQSVYSPTDSEWKLEFSRGLSRDDGKFAGIVMLTVGAYYFVSGYDKNKLGNQGELGLAGAQDGIFRVRRTGDETFYGDALDSVARHTKGTLQDTTVTHSVDLRDGITRIRAIRPMYAFPLALIVGVSEEEQLAATRANARSYLLLALIASVVLLFFLAILGRVSWRLAQTAQRENEAKLAHAERIQYLAYRDVLTGLPNRAYFSKMLEQGITQSRRYNRPLAVLFLDLDRFKQINDTLGHQVGDQLLQEVAARLRACLRESDTLARLGGDEFVVLLPEYGEEKDAGNVAQKLLNVISKPFPFHGQQLIGTTSIGIAICPQDGQDEQTLMKHADSAMYHAKEQGKNNFQFYSSQLQVDSLAKLRLETSLRQAVERHELVIHYQPKIDLHMQCMTGMEALLRWHSPEHGNVPPSIFIPIAEDTGLIVPIGKWVLETACAQSMVWQNQGLPPLCLAVNLSGRQFNDDQLMDDITTILNRTGLDPSLLELEITESMLMYNVDKAIRTLTALSDMKIRLAIDDFGTGYSSLSNLKRFPLNTLKIDHSFISSLPHGIEDRVITEAIIHMAKALKLTVVAEGVEEKEQVDFLKEKSCDQCQGFYFSRPVSSDDFRALLEAQLLYGVPQHPARAQQSIWDAPSASPFSPAYCTTLKK